MVKRRTIRLITLALVFASLLVAGFACTTKNAKTDEAAASAEAESSEGTVVVNEVGDVAVEEVIAVEEDVAVEEVIAVEEVDEPAVEEEVVVEEVIAVEEDATAEDEVISEDEVVDDASGEEAVVGEDGFDTEGNVQVVYGDIVMTRTEEAMRDGEVEAVVFPHWFHRIRFRCKVCHEDTFVTDKGENEIDMDMISAGESCGMCHDGNVAWDPLECEACHFYPWEQLDDERSAKDELVKVAAKSAKSSLFAGRSGKMAGKGDGKKKSGTAFKWGDSWQPRAFRSAGLPKDKYGLIDWIKLTEDDIALPQGSLDPEDPLYESPVHYVFDEDGDEDIEDIVIPVKSESISAVLYPHTTHTWWLKCKSCHPKRFDRGAGDTEMTMKEMGKGLYCGECHGKVAFPLEDCNRCHNKKRVESCKASENCTY
jgi:c(7)-type cytochrome triheme protein